jgi:hypothetical protein
MKIIHAEDDPFDSTLILAIAWHLPEECQVEGCKNKTAAIVCMTEEESPTGSAINISICEEHYQKGIREGKLNEKFIL